MGFAWSWWLGLSFRESESEDEEQWLWTSDDGVLNPNMTYWGSGEVTNICQVGSANPFTYLTLVTGQWHKWGQLCNSGQIGSQLGMVSFNIQDLHRIELIFAGTKLIVMTLTIVARALVPFAKSALANIVLLQLQLQLQQQQGQQRRQQQHQ